MDFSDYQTIAFSREGRVLTITLNRPDKLNATDALMHEELARVFTDAARDPDSDVLVFTGAGRAFCAGVDLAELGAGDAEFAEPASRAVALLDEFPKPLIMAVNGLAVGIGTTMLGYADLAFAEYRKIEAGPPAAQETLDDVGAPGIGLNAS